MTKDKKPAHPGDADAKEIEREARAQVRFSLAEAIGRAGSDLLKGASPVTRRRQAVLAIEQFLERHLEDAEGAIQVVLLRIFSNSEALLEDGYNDPFEVLTSIAERLQRSEEPLRQFVRAVDTEWGRMYLERPYFEKDGHPPHRDDPYTVESVRSSLKDLLAKLAAAHRDPEPSP